MDQTTNGRTKLGVVACMRLKKFSQFSTTLNKVGYLDIRQPQLCVGGQGQ